jgi:hypothetical protein
VRKLLELCFCTRIQSVCVSPFQFCHRGGHPVCCPELTAGPGLLTGRTSGKWVSYSTSSGRRRLRVRYWPPKSPPRTRPLSVLDPEVTRPAPSTTVTHFFSCPSSPLPLQSAFLSSSSTVNLPFFFLRSRPSFLPLRGPSLPPWKIRPPLVQ